MCARLYKISTASSQSHQKSVSSLKLSLMLFFFFFLMIRRPPSSPLFPNPTLFRSLRLDLLLGVDAADLSLDVDEHAPQSLLDREGLEQGLALGRLPLDVARHEVGEPAGIRDSVQEIGRAHV